VWLGVGRVCFRLVRPSLAHALWMHSRFPGRDSWFLYDLCSRPLRGAGAWLAGRWDVLHRLSRHLATPCRSGMTARVGTDPVLPAPGGWGR